MKAISDSNKKRGRGRPTTGIGRAIGLRLYPELEARLAAWVKARPTPRPSQPEAIRQLLEQALLPPEMIARIEAWAKRNGAASTSSAIRALIDVGLRGR